MKVSEKLRRLMVNLEQEASRAPSARGFRKVKRRLGWEEGALTQNNIIDMERLPLSRRVRRRLRRTLPRYKDSGY